jgi:transcriptional regulator with XRE-family HTH domain
MTIRSVSLEAPTLQYPLYRTASVAALYDAVVGKKGNQSKGQPSWAAALDAHVKASKTVTWAKIAARLDMTEGGIRHWRNGTREIKLNEFLALCKAASADPKAILQGRASYIVDIDLQPREEMILDLFRGLTPQQQRELTLETLAQVDANRYVQRHVHEPLKTYSNEEVRAAFGDVADLIAEDKKATQARSKKGAAPAEEDPE